MAKALAIKYRPKTWDDVTEQSSVRVILQEQIRTNTVKHGYLFCGGAGTGKTTIARIFSDDINDGQGTPIEMDAASHNSVDDIRAIIAQAQTKSLDSEYKVFIIDECHSLSNSAWQTMLKTLEEPPAKSIFIFCTTDPQKIPKTILSRVQRYDFQRISQEGIVKRLKWICDVETKDIMEEMGDQDSATDIEWAREQHLPIIEYDMDALEYLAKLADGGMRDAITLMDKCLSYSTDLTVENVVKALGIANYDIMFSLFDSLINHDTEMVLSQIDSIYASGIDIKQFVKTFTEFILDICKYGLTKDFSMIHIPNTYSTCLQGYDTAEYNIAKSLLKALIELNAEIKWDTSPKYAVEAKLFIFSEVKNG